jgi:DeoR/GlpR family transcriptional regulator of sugar metabolism
LDKLKKQPGLRVSEIALVMEVSEGTVRNDLNALENEGFLTRVHGGAVLSASKQLPHPAFSTRHQVKAAEKECMGIHASKMINDGDSILLDASSTVYYLALNLQEYNRLRVVTNGIDVARLLAQNLSNTVILLGGVVNQDGSSVTGLLSEQIITELRIQKAFVSCSGLSIERGMTEVHLEEAQLKRTAIESAQQVIALVDSSKFGLEDLTSFTGSDKITHLFTDSGIDEEWKTRLERSHIPFTICGDKLDLGDESNS